jgi:5-methyltetrahydropteroyltriglutamate--homocysteine methyltransferase
VAAPVARAETVGSLLRPGYLLQARRDKEAGIIDDRGLREVEDRAIREAIALQESIGLDVITDGELRRLSWIVTIPLIQDRLHAAPVGGFSYFVPDQPSFMAFWRNEEGRRLSQRSSLPRAFITEPLRVQGDLLQHEYSFLKANAHTRTKYSFPAPSYHRVFWHPQHSRNAYPTAEAFMQAIRDYLREHVVEPLIEAGCDYIQLDAPNYGQFYVDPEVRDALQAEGHDLDKELIADAEIDNSLFEGLDGITCALHVCRGNGPGGIWSASGGYAPIAREAFGRLTNLTTLLLEYDTERAGDFSPLAHVRHDTVVVLGLLTTKRGALEGRQEIQRRIQEATQHVPLERLALSPQCGFNSAGEGNPLSPAEQEAKLRLVVDVARTVWA